jgi:hypothetical protein
VRRGNVHIRIMVQASAPGGFVCLFVYDPGVCGQAGAQQLHVIIGVLVPSCCIPSNRSGLQVMPAHPLHLSQQTVTARPLLCHSLCMAHELHTLSTHLCTTAQECTTNILNILALTMCYCA